MLTDLFKSMLGKMDKASRSIELPGAFIRIKTDETNFELLLSSTIQKLVLYHKKSHLATKEKQEKQVPQGNEKSSSAISADDDLPPGSWIWDEELEDFQWHTNWTEQAGRNSFKRAFELWEDRPHIMDLEEVQKLETFNPYSIVYHLTKQQLILHMVTKDIASLDFVFYEAQVPFRKKKKELSIAISKGNRAMLVNDLRSEESKTDNCIYAMVNVHDFYATGTTFKVVKITFSSGSSRQLRNYGDVDEADPLFDFKSDEFRLELQRNNVWASQLVNCFYLEKNIFLMMMVDKTVVCDENFKILANIREDVMYSNLRCCSVGYPKQGDRDSQVFVQGFIYEKDKSNVQKGFRVANSPAVKRQLACKVENRIGLVAPQHVYEGNNSPEGVSSLVIHVTFDYTDYKLNHTLEDREHAILLKREKVASALEFAPNRLVVATEFSLLLFHAGECVRVYDEWDQDQPFVAQHERVKILNRDPGKSTYQEMWLTNKDRNPLGHFAVLPRFDQDQFPFITCTSAKGIMLINLRDNYAETLIDATSSCAWGQPALFFTREGNGMSMHFTISKRLNDRVLRLQWVRMPLKTDFIETLRTVGRLPATNQTEELLEDLQELNELQYLERRPSNRHRREIQRQYQQRQKAFDKESRLVQQELEHVELLSSAVYQKQIYVGQLQVRVMELVSRFLATNRLSVMAYNAPVYSNTKRKFHPSFTMELPHPAITSMFNTVSINSNLSAKGATLADITGTGSSSHSGSSMKHHTQSIPNSPTSHVSISLVLQAMNQQANSPQSPRNPFNTKQPTIDALQPYMRMPVAVHQGRGARNDKSLSNESNERSNSGSQPRVMGYKNGSPTSALPQRPPAIGQSLRVPAQATNWFRQRSQSGSHHTSDSESPHRHTLQPRKRVSKTKLSNSLSPGSNDSQLQITNVLTQKTPVKKGPLSPLQGAPTTASNIISHTPRQISQSQGGRRHKAPPLGIGNGLFSDPDLCNAGLTPRDMTAGPSDKHKNIMSEKQFVKLGGLELSTAEIVYDKQISGIENKYSDSQIERSKHQKFNFHPDEILDVEEAAVPEILPDLLWQAVDKSAEILLSRHEALQKVEAGIKLRRQERHDLFKNLAKVQTNESLFKYIGKLFNRELTQPSEENAVSTSEIELESLDIEDDSLATIQSENETDESEVNYRQDKLAKATENARPQIRKKPSMPRSTVAAVPYIVSGENTV